MKGFNILEKGKLITSFKKCNKYQLLELQEMINKEIERRRKKETF